MADLSSWFATALIGLSGVISSASLVSAAIKRFAGKVDPDSQLGNLLVMLDWLGATSRKVHDDALIAQHEQTIAEHRERIDNQHQMIADAEAKLATQASVIKALQTPGTK